MLTESTFTDAEVFFPVWSFQLYSRIDISHTIWTGIYALVTSCAEFRIKQDHTIRTFICSTGSVAYFPQFHHFSTFRLRTFLNTWRYTFCSLSGAVIAKTGDKLSFVIGICSPIYCFHNCTPSPEGYIKFGLASNGACPAANTLAQVHNKCPAGKAFIGRLCI